MTAAQVLTSGSLSPPSTGARPAEGRRAPEGEASFREALDSASRENGADAAPAARAADRAEARPADADDRDTGGEAGDGTPDEATPRGEAAGAAELSLLLAALGVASADATEPEAAAEADLARPASQGAGALAGAGEEGPWLPGEGEADEALEAARLMALLDGTRAAPDAGLDAAAADPIKASVAGQETHLALAPAPGEMLARLEAASKSVDGGPATAQGDTPWGVVAAKAGEAQAEAVPVRASGAGADPEGMERGAVRAAPGADGAPRGLAPTASDAQGGETSGQDGRGASAATAAQGAGQSAAGQGAAPGNASAFAAVLGGLGAAAADGDGVAVYDAPAQQVAAGIGAELKASGLGAGTSEGVVKVLKLELKPAHLGTVTVRIALKDNALTLHLEAARRETLVAIERDREALAGALSAAGYSIDSITAAPQSDASRSGGTQAGLGNGAASPDGRQPGQGLANSSSGGERGSDRSGPGYSSHRSPSDDKDAGSFGVQRGADGLYV